MPDALYTELKAWQTGLGALFGFLALMAAALWNFSLNRRRDAALRAEESIAVAVALYGEICLLRAEVASMARVIAIVEMGQSSITDETIELHRPSDPILYPALASKLGLLAPTLVLPITRFYADLADAKRSLPFIVDRDGRNYSPLAVLEPALRAVDNIEPALRSVESLAEISASNRPDTGNAEDVIEFERLKFNDAYGQDGESRPD